ncbi:hypothetical protein ABZU76_02975 [Amycolatopsis sp. NPDC005232]|uniref:hypothetical protein n=1 Tax=Amycolatopsis sp. NPDC005232 TaxID=3157027 RepID=UPI0033B4ECED
MAQVHGKNAYVSLDDKDLSAFCNNIAPKRSADSHDVTTFGSTAHKYAGGLLDGTNTLTGIYESGASGPKKVVEPLLGTVVELVYRPEGTGTGKPEDTVNVLVTAYEETTPVADMITWSATLQLTGAVVNSTQA